MATNGGFVRSTTDSPVLNLIASHEGLVTRPIVIADGQTGLAAGAVLGKIDSSGEYVLSDEAAVDGSEVPVAVLLLNPGDSITTSGASERASAIVGGQVLEGALSFGGAFDIANTKTPLQDVGIYTVPGYPEGGFTPNL